MKIGDEVGWQWGNGVATGVIESIHHERTEIESKGSRIVRNGTSEDPALILTHSSGAKVLKLQHEVKRLQQREGEDV